MTDITPASRGNGESGSTAPAEPSLAPTAQNSADKWRHRMRRLPPEVGAVLVAAGVVGILLPGPVGTPLLLAGGLALMPGVFGRLDRWVERRYPKLHGEGIRHVDRFINDLEKRFPADSPPE